jgi:hypothetical protein
MMNQKLAVVTADRMTRGVGIRVPLYCQRWVRECVQEVYGGDYDEFWAGSAKATARRFLAAAKANTLPTGVKVIETSDPFDTQLGDLLYRLSGSGGFGHVGIRIGGNKVAENSVTKFGRTKGAIGWRHLLVCQAPVETGWWGSIEVVVRLPE